MTTGAEIVTSAKFRAVKLLPDKQRYQKFSIPKKLIGCFGTLLKYSLGYYRIRLFMHSSQVF